MHRFPILSVLSFTAVVLMLLLTSGSRTFAQTTPTAWEKSVGTNCTNSSAASDFDAIAQCTSTGDAAGTMQKAPLFVGTVTSPPYVSTVCDSSKAGMIQYTASGFQGCNGSSWIALGVVPHVTKCVYDYGVSGTTGWKSHTWVASNCSNGLPNKGTYSCIMAVNTGTGSSLSDASCNTAAGGVYVIDTSTNYNLSVLYVQEM